MSSRHLAIDLGAESGRVMHGTLENSKIELHEIHRFKTGVWDYADTMRWNLPQFVAEITQGIKLAQDQYGEFDSASCDSWGVDYALFSKEEPLLSLPYHYRAPRTQGLPEELFKKIPASEIYSETGIQFMELNTIYQMFAETKNRPQLLATADSFLNIADYLNYILSGVAKSEESLASTTQMYSPVSRSWSKAILSKLGLPEKIFPQIVPSATVLGNIHDRFSKNKSAKVIATCSHDTGAAVAAVPASSKNWAYLSSGTWSLLGLELEKPIINDSSLKLNFTNEVGYGSSIRFLKNIVGLWIVQECKRDWEAAGNNLDYAAITQKAESAASLKSLIRPDSAEFGAPGNMVQKIQDYCKSTQQPVPQAEGEIIRCVLESLALLYGEILAQLKELTNREIDTLHIVGGGSKNDLLNQLAASSTGCRVLAGPGESTAIGNILLQALALKKIASLAELRQIVAQSFEIKEFKPQPSSQWDDARKFFRNLPIK